MGPETPWWVPAIMGTVMLMAACFLWGLPAVLAVIEALNGPGRKRRVRRRRP